MAETVQLTEGFIRWRHRTVEALTGYPVSYWKALAQQRGGAYVSWRETLCQCDPAANAAISLADQLVTRGCDEKKSLAFAQEQMGTFKLMILMNGSPPVRQQGDELWPEDQM